MDCLICGKKYFTKRTLHNLFNEKATYRCPSCSKKYQINILHQVVPKNMGVIHIYSLFLENNKFNLTAFNEEINELLNKLIKFKRKRDYLLWIDDLKEDILLVLDELDNNIYLITNTPYF